MRTCYISTIAYKIYSPTSTGILVVYNILTTKYKYGMLKPMLVKKLDIVYSMNTGSLSREKSNNVFIVLLASAEQQIPSENWSLSIFVLVISVA